MTLGTAFRLVGPVEADFLALACLVNAAFTVYPFMEGPRTTAEGIADEIGDSGRFVIADGAAGLAACAMLRPSLDVHANDTPGTVREADTMYLGLVAVDPEIRKQGLGRAVIAEAERIAATAGYLHMSLGTLREMGNVTYYERLGYRVVDEYAFPPGHWSMTIPHQFCVMVKEL